MCVLAMKLKRRETICRFSHIFDRADLIHTTRPDNFNFPDLNRKFWFCELESWNQYQTLRFTQRCQSPPQLNPKWWATKTLPISLALSNTYSVSFSIKQIHLYFIIFLKILFGYWENQKGKTRLKWKRK